MESLSSRLKSFNKSKPSKTSKGNTLGWPHPTNFAANPNTLADAGFYFNPSADDPDNVVCFMCEKELGGWEEEDNPFDIHVEKCPKCPWAIARCSLEHDLDSKGNFVFKEPSRLPSNKALEKARLDTFGGKRKWWPHDSNKTHGATSKKLAKAGFVYTPQESGVHDDTATCFYCDLSLSGWDPEDDPITEHRKREERSGKSCPFFVADISTKPSTSKSTNGTRKSKAVSNKASTADATTVPSSGSDDVAVASRATTKRTKERVPASASTKPSDSDERDKAASQKLPRGKGRAKQALEEDDEGEKSINDVPRTHSTKQPSKRTDTKTPAKKGKKTETPPGDSDELREPSNARGRPETKSTSRKPQSEASGNSVKKYEDFVVPIDEGDDDQRSTSKRPTRARSKSKSRTDVTRPDSRASTKSHTRSRSKTSIPVEEELGDTLTKPGSSQARKSTRTRKEAPSSKARKVVDETTSTRPHTPDPPQSDIDMQVDEQRPDPRDKQKANDVKVANVQSGQKKIPMEDRSNTSHLQGDVQLSLKDSVHPIPTAAPAVSDEMVSSKHPPPAYIHHQAVLARPAEGATSKTQEHSSSGDRLMNAHKEIVTGHPQTPPRQRSAITPPPSNNHLHTVPLPIQTSTPALDLRASFLPPLADSPMKYTTELSETERSMTVEEYIRYEMTRELERLRLDGQRTIDNFRKHAAEVRARIEAL